MNGWHIYWAAWAGASFLAFGIPEMWAVFSGHPQWKLSSAVWQLEDQMPYPLAWRVVIAVTLIFVVYHLVYGSRH